MTVFSHAWALPESLRKQVGIECCSSRGGVLLQSYGGYTGIETAQCGVLDPLPQACVMPKGPAYLQPEEPRIRVYESRRDAAVSPVPVN
jgi:hypothetical protein